MIFHVWRGRMYLEVLEVHKIKTDICCTKYFICIQKSSSMFVTNLFTVLYVSLKNFSLTWRHHHYWWRASKFRPMLGTQGLWAGRDLYRETPAVTWPASVFPVSAKMPLHSVSSYDTQGDGEDLFLPISSRVPIQSPLMTCKGMWKTYFYVDLHWVVTNLYSLVPNLLRPREPLVNPWSAWAFLSSVNLLRIKWRYSAEIWH
jgi:hypothetical protein